MPLNICCIEAHLVMVPDHLMISLLLSPFTSLSPPPSISLFLPPSLFLLFWTVDYVLGRDSCTLGRPETGWGWGSPWTLSLPDFTTAVACVPLSWFRKCRMEPGAFGRLYWNTIHWAIAGNFSKTLFFFNSFFFETGFSYVPATPWHLTTIPGDAIPLHRHTCRRNTNASINQYFF